MNSDLNNKNKINDEGVLHDTMNPLKDREEDKYLNEKSLYSKDQTTDKVIEGGVKRTGKDIEHNKDVSQKDHLKHTDNGIQGDKNFVASTKEDFLK